MKYILWATACSLAIWSVSACGSTSDSGSTGTDGVPPDGGGAAGSGGAPSTTQSLVQLCQDAVDASCDVLSSCCQSGTQFDAFECNRTQLDACFNLLGLDENGNPTTVYDLDAASQCLQPLTDCPGAALAGYISPYYGYYGPELLVDSTDPEVMQACNRIKSGARPLGSACYDSSQCAAVEGDGFSECYYSPSRGEGVCARAETSTDGTCSFDTDTLVHRTCPTGAYCQTDTPTAGPVPPPPPGYPYPYPPYDPYGPGTSGSTSFAFDGQCVPLRTAGQPCFDETTGQDYPCADGLICSYEFGNQTCQKPLAEGQPCENASVDCEYGLYCDYASGVCIVDTAFDSTGVPFCYADPGTLPSCGDGLCDGRIEDPASCPQDCSVCGDLFCSPDEVDWCFEDCGQVIGPGLCGDAFCDPGEETYCPEDCGSPECMPYDACMAAQPDQPACDYEADCVCSVCNCQVSDCSLTKGCPEIAQCIESAGCLDAFDCYANGQCQTLIDTYGGPDSEAGFLATDLMMCHMGCPLCSAPPPPSVDAGSSQPPPEPADAGAPDGG
jgi:hypothetical protein